MITWFALPYNMVVFLTVNVWSLSALPSAVHLDVVFERRSKMADKTNGQINR